MNRTIIIVTTFSFQFCFEIRGKTATVLIKLSIESIKLSELNTVRWI